MALTGVMGADFSKFTDAVDAAEVKLRSFESGAGKVEKSLARMGDSFSGQKVIQDATLMAKVFEEMGGSAAFTEKELARMNATATEAAAKLTALGKDVPDGIRKVAEETQGAAKSTDDWTANVSKLAVQYLSFQGIMAAGRAALDFVKDVMAQAGALQDLSAQTHITAEDLQTMSGAMREFGVDADAMGRAIFKVGQAIAGGDSGVAAALKDMGLSLDAVRNLHGEELFVTLQDGLATLNGTARDTAAIALYGEKLGMVMSGAAEGTKDAIARWRELNGVMSNETVAALDAAGEHWDQLKQKFTVKITENVFTPFIKGLEDFYNVSEKAGTGAANWARAKDAVLEALGQQKTQFEALAESVGVETNKKKEEKAATEASTPIAAAHTAAIKAQGDEYKKLVEHMQEEVRLQHEKQNKKDADAAAGLKDFQRQTDEMLQNQDIVDGIVDKRSKQMAQQSLDSAHALADVAALTGGFTEQTKILTQAEYAAGGYTQSLAEVNKINGEAIAFDKKLRKEQDALDQDNKQLIDGYNALAGANTDAGKAAQDASDKAVRGATAAAGAQAQFNTQVNLTVASVREWIELQQYTAGVNAILSRNSLFTSPSQYENIANYAGGFTGIPGRAAGGPVSAGQAYVVGEQGPELFIPSVSGAIAPTAGPSITNVFHLVDTESNLARRVSEVIMRQVRAGTQLATT